MSFVFRLFRPYFCRRYFFGIIFFDAKVKSETQNVNLKIWLSWLAAFFDRKWEEINNAEKLKFISLNKIVQKLNAMTCLRSSQLTFAFYCQNLEFNLKGRSADKKLLTHSTPICSLFSLKNWSSIQFIR